MKKFIVYWDETYIGEDVDIVEEDFLNNINTDNGYHPENKIAIEKLNVGDSLSLDEGHHFIFRVK